MFCVCPMKVKPGLIMVFLFGLNVLAWFWVYDLSQVKTLEITFFDVGQGDAIFIETPESHQILIDGGPDGTVLEKLADEIPFWNRTIDLIVLTHPEHDHIGGLLEVLKRYKVENILWTGVLKETAEYKEWKRLIQEEGAKIYIAKRGLSAEPGLIEIKVLFPFESLENQEMSNTNNSSIIFRLVFENNSFLFTGDAPKTAERQLLSQAKEEIRADVLKVGHHGSKTSSLEEFVAGVLPAVAVISVGRDNKYGHPSPETLETLEKYGIKIVRTDLEGNIKITSNGQSYEVSTF